jgi:hypothetical protein
MNSSAETKLLGEAADPLTTPERLAELSLEHLGLRSAIAGNPSCSQALLNTLSIQHPIEVLNNPSLALAALENGNRYSLFPLKSLISLSLVCEPIEHPDLIHELKSRIAEGIDVFSQQDYASMTCIWLNRGSHVLTPSDCANAIEYPIPVRVIYRGYIESDGPVVVNAPEITSPDLAKHDKRNNLRRFLSDLGKGNLSDYIDTNELIREHNGDGEFMTEIDEPPKGVYLESNALYRAVEDEEGELYVDNLLVNFGYSFGGNEAHFENGYLMIPVEWEDETDIEFTIEMGELSSLIGLSSEGFFPVEWPDLVADLVFPELSV